MNENNEFLNGKSTPEQSQAKQRKPRTKKADIPLIETEEVTDIVVIDDRINRQLEKENVTEAVLKAMEDEFLGLTIIDINDKEGYQKVAKAESMCRNTRTLTIKICKSGRANALAEQRAWIKKEDAITERILNVENKLKERRKQIDDELEAIKEAKATAEQQRLQERAVKLIALGMNFSGDAYILDDIKISVLQVKQLDDFTYGQLLAGVEAKFKENQEIKAREEQLRLEAEQNNKRILEEALAKEEANKKREAELVAREEAIRQAELKAKAEAEERIRQQELEAKQKAEAEIARQEKEKLEKLNFRKSALFALGFAQQGTDLIFEPNKFSEAQLATITEDKWPEALDKITAAVNLEKDRRDKERIEREERIKTEAIAAERKRMEEEAEADRIAEIERKATEKAEQDRIAALAPDSDKLNAFCKSIMEVSIPAFSTDSYKTFAEIMKADRIEYLKNMHRKKPI